MPVLVWSLGASAVAFAFGAGKGVGEETGDWLKIAGAAVITYAAFKALQK